MKIMMYFYFSFRILWTRVCHVRYILFVKIYDIFHTCCLLLFVCSELLFSELVLSFWTEVFWPTLDFLFFFLSFRLSCSMTQDGNASSLFSGDLRSSESGRVRFAFTTWGAFGVSVMLPFSMAFSNGCVVLRSLAGTCKNWVIFWWDGPNVIIGIIPSPLVATGLYG